ncbi:MAG TPA: hypothetical protein PKN62_02870 [bacterium]|nr:hypothetical protein [bacterium]
MKKDKKIIIVIVAAIVLMGLSFWGGRVTAPKFKNGPYGQIGQAGQRNGQINQRGGKPSESRIMGQIEKIEDKQLVIKTMDGSSKMVMISDTTAFKKMASSSLSDIAIGQTAIVSGAQNSGVTIADSIEIAGNSEIR